MNLQVKVTLAVMPREYFKGQIKGCYIWLTIKVWAKGFGVKGLQGHEEGTRLVLRFPVLHFWGMRRLAFQLFLAVLRASGFRVLGLSGQEVFPFHRSGIPGFLTNRPPSLRVLFMVLAYGPFSPRPNNRRTRRPRTLHSLFQLDAIHFELAEIRASKT